MQLNVYPIEWSHGTYGDPIAFEVSGYWRQPIPRVVQSGDDWVVSGTDHAPAPTPLEAAQLEVDRLEAIASAESAARVAEHKAERDRLNRESAELKRDMEQAEQESRVWRESTIREHKERLQSDRARLKLDIDTMTDYSAVRLAESLLRFAREEERSVARGQADWKRSDDGRDPMWTTIENASSAAASWARRQLKYVKKSRQYYAGLGIEEYARKRFPELYPAPAPKPVIELGGYTWTVESLSRDGENVSGTFSAWGSPVDVVRKGGHWRTVLRMRHGGSVAPLEKSVVEHLRAYVMENAKETEK